MRERFITLVCALGALALFLTMFVHGEYDNGGGREISRPTTAEQGRNGYRAAKDWLEAEHVRAQSLRDRFDKLAREPGVAATGNLLLVTVPTAAAFRTEEFRPLNRWVGAGNTLVVLAALADNPDWASASGSLAASDLDLLTGLDFETRRARDARARSAAQMRTQVPDPPDLTSRAPVRPFAEPRRARLIPNRTHAYFAGVRAGIALSDFPTQLWTARVPYEGFVFTLAHEAETGAGALWTRPLGNGRIIISGFGSLFTNRALGVADNARLLANIIGANLGPGGTVLFDDVHQGLGAAYDPDRFWSDRRLHVTVGILCMLWLFWVLGTTRLRVPVTRETVPREVDLVRATGGFLAHALTPAAAARRLVDHFLRRLTQQAHSSGPGPSAAAALRALDRHSKLAPADVQQLRLWSERLNQAKRVPLLRLHNLIVRIQRQLNS